MPNVAISISTDEATRALGKALSGNTVLQKLDLRYSNLSGNRGKKLFKTLPPHVLESLLLSNCLFGSQEIKDLAEFFFDRGGGAITLDLRHNELGDEGAMALSNAMMSDSMEGGGRGFRSLILGNCLIGDDGAKSLAEALGREGNSLLELDLRGNKITEVGAAALAQAITIKKQGLLTLDLRENQIGDEGAQSIANALSNQCSLTELNISDNKIGNQGAKSIADSLALNNRLKRLLLYANAIGDGGARSFLKALEYNDSLLHLDLSRNVADKNLRQKIMKIIEANRRCKRRKKERPKANANCDLGGIMSGIFDALSESNMCGSPAGVGGTDSLGKE